MFKKTLLALTVAAMSGSAVAGNIYSQVSEITPTFTGGVGTAFGTDGATGGGEDDCLLAASALGVIADLGAHANATPAVAGVSDGNDTITVAAATPNAINASSVAFTGDNACTVTVGETLSTATAKSPIEAPAGGVTLTASIVSGLGGFAAEDTLTLTFSGAAIDVAKTTAPTLTQRGGAVLPILDITSTTLRFTVPAGETVTPTEILDLAGVVLDSTGLSTSSDVTIAYFATNTSGTQYDVTDPTSVHGLVPQYSASILDKFDGIINVSDDRQSLALNASDDFAGEVKDHDTLNIDLDLDATTNLITPDEINFVIKGNFAWLEAAANTSNDGKVATAAEVQTALGSYLSVAGGAFAAGDSASLNADLDELTIVDTTGGTVAATYAIRLTVPGQANGNPVLSATDYTTSVTVNDTAVAPNTNVMTAATDLVSGSWTLNGSVVTIPYMPFDANTAVIMRHTNTGVQTGDITVRYMLEGVSSDWEDAGVVASSTRGVMNIRDAVMNAIKTAAGLDAVTGAGKVAIEITTNVPTADVTVFAGFKVKDEQDRGIVGTFGAHGSAQ